MIAQSTSPPFDGAGSVEVESASSPAGAGAVIWSQCVSTPQCSALRASAQLRAVSGVASCFPTLESYPDETCSSTVSGENIAGKGLFGGSWVGVEATTERPPWDYLHYGVYCTNADPFTIQAAEVQLSTTFVVSDGFESGDTTSWP